MSSPHLFTNDNSNPQQGTGIAVLMKSSSEVPATGGGSNNDNGNLLKNAASTDDNTPPTTEEIRKLFVGGLPTDITEPEFRSFFEQFGELHDCIVMFDRDTHRSRGFGFVTFVDPEVANSLLRMGDHDDGVGRLVMRGKPCEVKVATPKGERGFGRGGRTSRSGSHHNRDQRKHDSFQTVGYGHAMGSYAYTEHLGYVPAMRGIPFQAYPGTAASGAGVPPYMAPVYYPTVPYPHTQPSFAMPPPLEEFSNPGDTVTSPPFYDMAPPSPDAAANFVVPVSHHPSVATSGVPMTSPPVPLSLPMHSRYHHLGHPTFSQQQAAYAFLPVAPVPPSAGVPGPHQGVAVQATSVMQPVAPGLPFKNHDNGSHDLDNTGGESVTQTQEIGGKS